MLYGRLIPLTVLYYASVLFNWVIGCLLGHYHSLKPRASWGLILYELYGSQTLHFMQVF